MEKIVDSFNSITTQQLLFGSIAAVGLAFAIKNVRWKKEKKYPKDVVILHAIGRASNLPSASPFVLKLETFLRMAKIKYQNENDGFSNKSKVGKFPWISFNGEEIADSQFSIDYLKDKFEVDLDSNYSKADIAAGRAVRRMLEEATFWGLALSRTVYQMGTEYFKKMNLPWWKIWIIGKVINRRSKVQGTGLHPMAKVKEMTVNDLRAVSQFLGNKKYFLGETPSEVDATIFGFVTQFVYTFPNTDYDRVSKEEFRNLYSYCDRMKEKFWPDWDECILEKP